MMEEGDDLPAVITHGQLRELLEMRESYKRMEWLLGFLGRVAKVLAMVAAATVAAQTVYSNFVRGVVIK